MRAVVLKFYPRYVYILTEKSTLPHALSNNTYDIDLNLSPARLNALQSEILYKVSTFAQNFDACMPKNSIYFAQKLFYFCPSPQTANFQPE